MSGAKESVGRVDGLLREFRRRYPDALAECGQIRDTATVSWPEWCWLPMAGVQAYLTGRGGAPLGELAKVTALTAWRLGRGAYEVDAAVVTTSVLELHSSAGSDARTWTRAVLPPLELWTGLPEWCCYLVWPQEARLPEGGVDLGGVLSPLGLFVHLEADANSGRPELRLLVDTNGTWEGLQPIPVYLDRPTLGAAMGDMEGAAAAMARGFRGADVRSLAAPQTPIGVAAWGVLPLALTLIDPAARFVGPTPGPRRAQPREGLWKPARESTVWRVTYREPKRRLLLVR